MNRLWLLLWWWLRRGWLRRGWLYFIGFLLRWSCHFYDLRLNNNFGLRLLVIGSVIVQFRANERKVTPELY
jgi:hypothetical protein